MSKTLAAESTRNSSRLNNRQSHTLKVNLPVTEKKEIQSNKKLTFQMKKQRSQKRSSTDLSKVSHITKMRMLKLRLRRRTLMIRRINSIQKCKSSSRNKAPPS